LWSTLYIKWNFLLIYLAFLFLIKPIISHNKSLFLFQISCIFNGPIKWTKLLWTKVRHYHRADFQSMSTVAYFGLQNFNLLHWTIFSRQNWHNLTTWKKVKKTPPTLVVREKRIIRSHFTAFMSVFSLQYIQTKLNITCLHLCIYH